MLLFVVLIVLFFIALYCVPSIVAISRKKKKDVVAIVALNLLLGWTLIGWVISLVWALRDE